jgi:hypothetical protein
VRRLHEASRAVEVGAGGEDDPRPQHDPGQARGTIVLGHHPFGLIGVGPDVEPGPRRDGEEREELARRRGDDEELLGIEALAVAAEGRIAGERELVTGRRRRRAVPAGIDVVAAGGRPRPGGGGAIGVDVTVQNAGSMAAQAAASAAP